MRNTKKVHQRVRQWKAKTLLRKTLIYATMVLSIGDDVDGEHDSDVDDIEIVSEDIRCKMNYENLSKDLKPEWKEFIKSVIDFQVNSLKPDQEMDDDTRKKMSDRQFYSYQIRQGQRLVAKTFKAA